VTDATTEFFSGLGERGHEPALEKANGILRFDVSNGKKRPTRWTLEIERGDLRVSHRNAKADCVVKTDHALADGIVRGEINPVAALLRGAIAAEGDIRLFVLFMRVLPSPPRSS
jgi:putative sterol carrier protein